MQNFNYTLLYNFAPGVMLHLLLIAGLFSLGICLPRQYHFIDHNKTWFEAQRYCKENYIDLASIHNDDEQLAVTDITRLSRQTWVGLYDDLNSWKWSLDDDSFYTKGEKDFRNWYIEEPYNLNGDNVCVNFVGSQTSWWVASCSDPLPFICFNGRVNASESYILVNERMNWTEAQKYCREHHTDLTSVRNENENQKIAFLLSSSDVNYKYLSVWIGLHKIRSWSDKSNSTFSYWSPGQPIAYNQAGYCTAVFVFSNGKWVAQNCSQAFPFFCYSTLKSSRLYHFILKNMTWIEAQIYCRRNFIDLATIDTMDEMNTLLKTVPENYTDLAWIGLYDDVDSWRWSLDNKTFYQNGERDFRGWTHQPDNSNGQELCVLMNPKGKWFDMRCILRLFFVCYDGTTNQYVVIYQQMTWKEAQIYCRANYRDLASVRNEMDLQQIKNVSNKYEVWIGLYRNRSWSDQSNLSYTNWEEISEMSLEGRTSNIKFTKKTHQLQHCTSVDPTGKWIDEYCLARFPFICYSEFTPGAVMGLQLKIKVIGNPSLLEIRRMLLNKLKEKLNNSEFPSNFILNVTNIRNLGPF